MKKSLIALAVIGAFAGTASAQTNVTLYGIGDAGIGMADSKAPGSSSTVSVFSGVQSTSRFGIRGTEDLGSGLKATFNIESEVDFSTGNSGADTTTGNVSSRALSSGFWQRRAVVGLAGGFGEVRLGRDYTPGFTAAGTTDVMGYGLFGNWLTFTASGTTYVNGAGVLSAAAGGITTRASNGLHYTSPNWGGLTVRAMYATGEQDGSIPGVPKRSGDMYGLSGVYANGPLTVSGYWQATKVPNVLATGTNTNDQYGVGAQYNFGMFRVALNYGEGKPDVGPKLQGWGLGGGVKIGTGEVLVNFIQQKLKVGGAFEDPKGTTWGLAYVHPMSKRTNLYASYGQTRNNGNSTFGLRYSQSQVDSGGFDADPRAFAIGIRHMF